MKKALMVLAVLMCGQHVFSQNEQKKEPVGAGAVIADPMKIANLQLDLLMEQRKNLEITADWLRAEQKAFDAKVTLWEKSRDELKKHLDTTFGCLFDLDGRKCRPKEEPLKEGASATKDVPAGAEHRETH